MNQHVAPHQVASVVESHALSAERRLSALREVVDAHKPADSPTVSTYQFGNVTILPDHKRAEVWFDLDGARKKFVVDEVKGYTACFGFRDAAVADQVIGDLSDASVLRQAMTGPRTPLEE